MKEGAKNRPPQDAAGPDQHELTLKSESEGFLNVEQRLFDAVVTEASREATHARQKAIQHQFTDDQYVLDFHLVQHPAEARAEHSQAKQHRRRIKERGRELRRNHWSPVGTDGTTTWPTREPASPCACNISVEGALPG